MDSSTSKSTAHSSPNPPPPPTSSTTTSTSFPHRPTSSRRATPELTTSPANPSSSSGNGGSGTPIPDEDHGADLPLTMSASVVLSSLPRDAHKALTDVENVDVGKVTIRFQPLPGSPILKNRVFKVSASQKFETVVKFLRKKLDCKDSDSVFCYVNSVFAPGLDEGVGGLWRCFKTEEQLIVAYSMTPAFG